MNDIEPVDLENFQSVTYGIKVKASLNNRISNHVRALKHLEGQTHTKKRWIQEAIKEKLQSWKEINTEEIQADCNLGFSISKYMNHEIEEIVNLLKKLGVKMCKTDFFLEAIKEKLNKEEVKTKLLFQNMLKSSVNK